ncbi:MAG: type II toxin-antitoxin system VapC family toxin [Candidatus Methylomirabilia bacterium]
MIVLDTHVWLWWISNPELLSAAARKTLDHAMAEGEICISSISAWEVAILVKKGRLDLTMPAEDWIARSEALPFLRFIPVDNRIALKSANLPGQLHDDPADRVIIATTISLGGTLITKDEKIRKYQHVRTLW